MPQASCRSCIWILFSLRAPLCSLALLPCGLRFLSESLGMRVAWAAQAACQLAASIIVVDVAHGLHDLGRIFTAIACGAKNVDSLEVREGLVGNMVHDYVSNCKKGPYGPKGRMYFMHEPESTLSCLTICSKVCLHMELDADPKWADSKLFYLDP